MSSSDEKVYIGDLHKPTLLRALWGRSTPAAFFLHSGLPAPSYNEKEAIKEAKDRKWYIDYLQGRVIKSNLSGDEARVWGFDRDLGQGAMKGVVEAVRKGQEKRQDDEQEQEEEQGKKTVNSGGERVCLGF